MPQLASWSSPDIGWSREPSHGWGDAEDLPRTGRSQSCRLKAAYSLQQSEGQHVTLQGKIKSHQNFESGAKKIVYTARILGHLAPLLMADWGPDRLNDFQCRDLMETVEDRYGAVSTLDLKPVTARHLARGDR